MASKWKGYQKAAEEAAKEASDKIKPCIVPIPTEKPRKEYGSSNRAPFEGYTKEDSDQIREVVALKFAGYTLMECATEVGISTTSMTQWMARRQDAMALAEKEHLERCLRSYQNNLWIIRTALSEMGPRAIRTLSEIMMDRKAPPSVRVSCATTVLKMLDVDHSATGGGNENMAKEFVAFLKDARKEINSERIVEAEEAEVIEDGNHGG
jgi:hypothetical protein